MEQLLGQILAAVASYGPFPFGVLIGILLSHLAYSKAFKMHQQERDAIKEERKGNQELISAMQERIDKLHHMISDQRR